MARRCSCIPRRQSAVVTCTAGPIGLRRQQNLVPGDSPLREGIPAQFREKKIGAHFGSPHRSPLLPLFFSPEAQSVNPPLPGLRLPLSILAGTTHPSPHPKREAAFPRRPSHVAYFTPQFPTAKLRPSITPTRRVDNRPTGDCAFAPRLSCRCPSVCDLPSLLGRIGQPNQPLAKPGSDWSSLNPVSISAHWRAKKMLKGLSRARAWVDSLFCCFCSA